MSKIIDGKEAAAALITKLKKIVAGMSRSPKLVVVQVGDNAASSTYIRQKQKAAEKCGIDFELKKFPSSFSVEEIKNEVKKLNQDSTVDAFIVQLPLESDKAVSKKEEEDILELIDPKKDADGMHTYNQGRLFCNQSEIKNRDWTFPISATALGILRLLEHYEYKLLGEDVVVIGKSRLVGMPAATLLSHAGATVTICHRMTKELSEKTKFGKILIVATGKKHLIGLEHVTEDSVVIDVGIHHEENGKLTGDVSPRVYDQVEAYSPVPGGVGPMTVAALMENTVILARQSQNV